MKKIIILLVAAVMTATSLSAQDLITKKDGTDIQAKILEVNKTELKYKRWDNQDGPTFTIDKSDVLLVRYQNGTNEVFNETATPATHQAVTPARTTSQPNRTVNAQNTPATGDFFAKDPSLLRPGMKFREANPLYDNSDYSYLASPKYSTSRAWLNLIVPGLAQFTMGEGGLGALYLGMSALGDAVALVGGTAAYDYDVAIICMLSGAAITTTFGVISIINAVKVAKVKSLLNADLEKLNQGYSLVFAPTVVPTYTPSGLKMAPSVGLRLTF